MDIEQMKLILETMSAAGEGAFTFGIFWLAKELSTNIIVLVGALIIFLSLFKVIRTGVQSCCHNDEFRGAAHIDRSTPMNSRDATTIIDLIKRGHKK